MDTERRFFRHRAVGALASASLTVAASAFGQTSSPEDMASARVLGTDGVRLADSGDCGGAVAKLEAAEKLFHAPTTLERLAECQVSLGHVVAGTESLNRVLREHLSPTAPQAFVAAHDRAERALAAALPRIAKLRIHVDGAPVDATTVTVDGTGVPSALLDSGRPTDPGHHEVKATAPGFRAAVAPVALRDGADVTVALKLEADPGATAPPPGASIATGPVAAPSTERFETETPRGHASPRSGGPSGLAIGALAVGGAGLLVGSVFGVLTLGSKSSLDAACTNKTCPPSSQGDIDALGSRATLSTIGFGVGIVGVAVGTILLVMSGHADSAGVAPAKGKPWVGLGAAGLEATFE